jgi:predicted  nucleic acid-binding Zn-ribbon protein
MNFSSSSAASALLTLAPTQEHGPDHGVDADQAERDARELTTAFQHALTNNNANVDDDVMDVDSDTYNCEGEDERDEDGDEMVLVDPQVQSAKEWVCVRTYGMYHINLTQLHTR